MAPNLESSNYQSILSQAQSQLNQLLNLTGSSKIAGGKDASSYVNSVFLLTNDTEQIVNGDDSQKANAINDIVSKLTDLLSNLGTKDSQKANQDVKKNDQKITANDNAASQTSTTIDAKLQEIMDKCNSGRVNIESALEEIKKLGGDDGVIASMQEELNAQLEIIEKSKETLNDENAKPEDRKQALSDILAAASAINSLVANVNESMEQIKAQNAVVKQASNEISELSTNATQILKEGAKKIQDYTAKAQQLGTENTQMGVKSVTEKTAGTTQVAIGEAMTSGPQAAVTASEGIKYQMSGNDKINAGNTLMQGSVQGLAKLTQSIGTYGNYLKEFNDFAIGIYDFTQGARGLVGEYDTTVNSYITAIGSWDTITSANEQLQSYVKEYSSTLPEDVKAEVNGSQESTGVLKPDETSQKTQNSDSILKFNFGKSETENSGTYQKFEFDTSIFKAKEKV